VTSPAAYEADLAERLVVHASPSIEARDKLEFRQSSGGEERSQAGRGEVILAGREVGGRAIKWPRAGALSARHRAYGLDGSRADHAGQKRAKCIPLDN